jgi:hypothetical protein
VGSRCARYFIGTGCGSGRTGGGFRDIEAEYRCFGRRQGTAVLPVRCRQRSPAQDRLARHTRSEAEQSTETSAPDASARGAQESGVFWDHQLKAILGEERAHQLPSIRASEGLRKTNCRHQQERGLAKSRGGFPNLGPARVGWNHSDRAASGTGRLRLCDTARGLRRHVRSGELVLPAASRRVRSPCAQKIGSLKR